MRPDDIIERPSVDGPLLDALRTLDRDGVGSVLNLIGEAGIGKSTAVRTAMSAAEASGIVVLSNTATELDLSAPFSLVGQLRSSLAEKPVRMLRTSASSGTDDALGDVPPVELERFRYTEELLTALEAACREPTLLVLEDIHWADAASLAALEDIVELAHTQPLVVVLTRRPGHRAGDLARVDRALRGVAATELRVAPLEPDEIERLLTLVCGGRPSAPLRERIDGAAGNPFLITEFATGVLAEGRMHTADGEVDVDGDGPPSLLVAAIEEELRRLGSEVTQLLRAAAVSGPVVDIAVVAAVLQRPPLDLNDPLTTATEAGLLVAVGRGDVAFRHELVRASVYASTPVALRSAIHQQVADALAARDAPASIVGSHVILSGDAADAAASAQLQRAAQEAATTDPATALRFLDRARDLHRSDLVSRQAIERARLRALTAAGRLDEAETVANWLLESADVGSIAPLRLRLAGLQTLRGDPRAALEHLVAAERSVDSDRERSPILAASASAALLAGALDDAAAFAEQAEALGVEVRDPVGRSIGGGVRARLAAYRGDVTEALRLGATAVALADTDQTGAAHRHAPALYYGITALNADRTDLAADAGRRGLELAEHHALPWSTPLYLSLSAAAHFHDGGLDDARAHAEAAVDASHRTGSRQALQWSQSLLTLVALAVGDLAEARRRCDQAGVTRREGGSDLGIIYSMLALARVRAAEGDVDGALGGLRRSWDMVGVAGSATRQAFLSFDLWRLARELGEEELAETAVEANRRAAARVDSATALARADWMTAVANDDAAAADDALARLRDLGRPLEVADALVVSATALSGADRPSLEAQATALYVDCGAVSPFGAGDLDPGSSAGATADGIAWHLLTPTQRAIAELLAQGLTNEEIARQRGGSRRTVEAHLRQVYQKLQIDGRVRLTVAAAAHFGPPST